MKRLLIVNNNLEIGGIQKSLLNLLESIHDLYVIDLLLFSKTGALLGMVPNDVNIISPRFKYAIYGLSKANIKKHPILFLFKSFLTIIKKCVSPRIIRKIIGIGQKPLRGYDAIISYTNLFSPKSLNAGCAEFVLEKTVCSNKTCFIHCDYSNSGTRCKENDELYSRFDKIICCSESVRSVFLKELPELSKKVYSLRNFYDSSIICKSDAFKPNYSDKNINVVMAARLSKEKGHINVIDALFQSGRRDLVFYFIGDGPLFDDIAKVVDEKKLQSNVVFLGEKANPYPFIKFADYLIVASDYEAAPMVFDEAIILGTKIVSSNTTSANEIVGNNGFIYSSRDELVNILKNMKKCNVKKYGSFDNFDKIKAFDQIIFGD